MAPAVLRISTPSMKPTSISEHVAQREVADVGEVLVPDRGRCRRWRRQQVAEGADGEGDHHRGHRDEAGRRWPWRG